MRTDHIYVLRDPATLEVRYVGCTGAPDRRRHEHESARAIGPNHPLTAWERRLKAEGTPPVFEVIATVQTDSAEFGNSAGRMLEAFYIGHFGLRGPIFNSSTPMAGWAAIPTTPRGQSCKAAAERTEASP